MKNKSLVITGILGLVFLAAGNAQTTFKLAFNQSEHHPQYKALKAFGEKLKKQTNGEYVIDIAPNALLGDQRATAELVQNGIIQMALVANPIIENYNKDFAVIGLPYVYNNVKHQEAVFTSGVLDGLFKGTEVHGFKVVGAFTAGSRNIYTKKAIKTPSDLAGLKIRVMQSDTMKKMLDLMGGVGTPMPQSEVYTAVQQGVLDGGENNEVTYAGLKHYEIAPFFSYTNHLMVPDLVIINTDTYKKMSDKTKIIFNKLMKETVKEEFTVWNKSIIAAKKVAIANGATFSDVSIKAFQDNVSPLQTDVINASKMTQKVYSDIRALAN